MGQRLEDVVLVALAGKELQVTAHRVTAPDAFGVCQYTADEMDIALDGTRSKAILDFLVEGETARVLMNGVYKTTVSVSDSLIEQDTFAVVYTTEHSAHLPLTLVSLGDNAVVSALVRREGREALVEAVTEMLSSFGDSLEILSSLGDPLEMLSSFGGSSVPEPSPTPTAVSYTREEHGLLTILKDVALLDSPTLKERAGISTGVYAGEVLRRQTERHGFAWYIGYSSTGSNKRFTLVPNGAEERIYKGLKLDNYEDIALVAREHVAAYFEEKASSASDLSKASVVHLQGKEYYLAPALDDIVAPAVPKAEKEKIEVPVPALPKEEQPSHGLIDIITYTPKGTVVDGVYMFHGRSVPLFAGKDTALVKYGEVFNRFTPGDLRFKERNNYQQPLREKLFLTNAPEQKRDDTGKLVPAEEKGRGKKHSLYVRDANQCLMYLVDTGIVVKEGNIKYHLERKTIDAIDILVLKDIAVVDRELLISQEFTDNQTRGALYGAVHFRGFVQYESSTRRKCVLVPKEGVVRFHPKLRLEEALFSDHECIAKEDVLRYLERYGAAALHHRIAQEPVMKFSDGKEYIGKKAIDEILREAGIDVSHAEIIPGEDAYQEQRETSEKPEAEILLLETYQPLGTRTGIDYVVGSIKRKLFPDDARARVTKFYEKAGLSTAHLEAEGLELLTQTDFTSHYKHPNGQQLSVLDAQKRIDARDDVFLPVAIANAAIMYLADHWNEIPAEEIASRKAWNFEEITFSLANGPGRQGSKQRYRVPVVADPNGEYIVGRAAILQALGVHPSNLHAAIPKLLELRVLGAQQGEIESGQHWLIHRTDINAIKHAIEYGNLPKNYIGHFAQ